MSKFYIIRNTLNNKVYVGQTTQPVEKRFRRHLALSCKPSKLRDAMDRLGRENFYVEHVASTRHEDKTPFGWDARIERDLIVFYDSVNNGYNQTMNTTESHP